MKLWCAQARYYKGTHVIKLGHNYYKTKLVLDSLLVIFDTFAYDLMGLKLQAGYFWSLKITKLTLMDIVKIWKR